MSLNLTATKFTSLRWGKSQLGGKEGSSGREREREREGATEEGKGSKEVREGNKRKGIRKGNQTRRVG